MTLPRLTHRAEFQRVTIASVPQRMAQPEVSNCLEKSRSKGEVSPSIASIVNYPCWLIMLTNSLQWQQGGYRVFFLLSLVSPSLRFTCVKVEIINKEPDHPLI